MLLHPFIKAYTSVLVEVGGAATSLVSSDWTTGSSSA